MEETPDDTRIIAVADYRWKYVIYALICWGVVLAGFLTFGAKERQWQFWMAEVVMGLFGSGLLYMLFNPRYQFIGREGKVYDKWLKDKYQQMLKDDGRFIYYEDGFKFHADEGDIDIPWASITKISARLEDEISNDDKIVLRIEYTGGHFVEFDEEVAGWLKFLQVLPGKFPGISEDWPGQVTLNRFGEMDLYQRS